MRPSLLFVVILSSIAIISCSKKDCGCAPPPPLANTEWIMVNYSRGLAGVNVDLPADHQHTVSFTFNKFTATAKPSGQETSGSYSTGAAPAGYENAFMLKFDKHVPVFATDHMIVLKNRNDSLVLGHDMADGMIFTLTKLK